MADVDTTRGPQGEGPRYQPEFSAGERLARLEALYEAFRRTETEWQDQLDRRFKAAEREVATQHQQRADELAALRREFNAAAEATDKAINKAGEAQEKQNTLTREEALRSRESMEQRVLGLERGESLGLGSQQRSQQVTAAMIGWVTVGVLVLSTLAAVIVRLS